MLDEYVVYLHEAQFKIGSKSMPFNDALSCAKCDNWFAAMVDELQFMKDLTLAYLVELSKNEIEKEYELCICC